jgi:hypothetical protein
MHQLRLGRWHIAGVNVVTGPVEEPAPGQRAFIATFSGFGLKPPDAIFVPRYGPDEELDLFELVVIGIGGNGEGSGSTHFPCEVEPEVFGKLDSLVAQATTAAGSLFQREFPPPSGC